MTDTALITTTSALDWTALRDTPADRNPALVYLAGLGSPAAVRTMRQALAFVIEIVVPQEQLLKAEAPQQRLGGLPLLFDPDRDAVVDCDKERRAVSSTRRAALCDCW